MKTSFLSSKLDLECGSGVSEDNLTQISQGGFSIIFKGQFRGTVAAVKKLFDPSTSEENKEEFKNEVRILTSLRHPYIITMLGFHLPQNCNDYQIIFEFIEQGNLYDFIHKKKKKVDAGSLLVKLAQVFNYIHQSSICHRDIKSMNILLTKELDPKIIDFGLARKFADLHKSKNLYTATPSYSAPEIFQKQKITEKVDVYAFGVLMWEILARRIPYEGMELNSIKKQVLGGITLKDSSISTAYQELIN